MGENNIKLFVAVVLIVTLTSCTVEEERVVREPFVADAFYPDDPIILEQSISEFLDNSEELGIDNIKAIVVPHAGYVYSGQVAAHSFKQLDSDYKRVFIFSDNHNSKALFMGASIPNSTHYKTPLGEVKLSSIKNELLKNKPFVSVPKAHETHIIEVEVPFLQKTLEDFEVIPIVFSSLSDEGIKNVADIISEYNNDETLFVFSVDLSHYYTYEEAKQFDSLCITSVLQQDYQEAKKCLTCAKNSLLLLLKLAEKYEWNMQLLDYKNSGDTAGNKDRVVGYSAM
ncbi:AmmeMemoRadiSam system protein B, partial [Candidatus Woesearchaeota archaeon]|nr:AmmeMemoRadiSam system protein B [Candidatus Woesearchaeota archaeon]